MDYPFKTDRPIRATALVSPGCDNGDKWPQRGLCHLGRNNGAKELRLSSRERISGGGTRLA